MANNRVFYPVHYVAIGSFASASGVPVHGVQSVSLTTTFNLEQVLELGQLNTYSNIENVPDIEMTVEKVLDGYPLIYHLATPDATAANLLNRTNKKADVFLSIFNDDNENASGLPETQAYCSGMFVNSLTYTLPVEGNGTESVTLVGNDKIWIQSSGQVWLGGTGFAFSGHFTGGDSPASGVQRRQNVKMGAAPTGSVWPTLIPGVTVVNGSGFNNLAADVFGAHIQDVSITTNLGREDLFELGRRKPYFRFVSFPTTVDCTINLTAGGAEPGDLVDADSSKDNLVDEPILLKLDDGTHFDLGAENKLQSVTYSGGDTGGGVASIAYAFQNFNTLRVHSVADPAGL